MSLLQALDLRRRSLPPWRLRLREAAAVEVARDRRTQVHGCKACQTGARGANQLDQTIGHTDGHPTTTRTDPHRPRRSR